MNSDLVLSSFEGETGVATITFNRPEVYNALNLDMAAALEEAVAGLQKNNERLRCVVLKGGGDQFMSGGDVGAFAQDLENADRALSMILNHMHPALLGLRSLNAPVLAAVSGVAAGAGFSLVLASDYVVARPDSRYVLAYDKLGTNPDCGASWFLPRKIGRARAFELMLLGHVLSAPDAAAAGIVNVVTGENDFEETVAKISSRIANGPTLAFGTFKRLMDSELPLETHLERERAGFVAATKTEDFRGAATAFMEKRKPSFTGR